METRAHLGRSIVGTQAREDSVLDHDIRSGGEADRFGV